MRHALILGMWILCGLSACGDSDAAAPIVGDTSNNGATTTNSGSTQTNNTTASTSTPNGATTPTECDAEEQLCDGVCTPTDTVERCGSCTPCSDVANASASCVEGACVYTCDPDTQDLNDDLADGCEFVCAPTGPEVCDGIDNDCDGAIDELNDALLSACEAPDNAEAIACDAGACAIACADGFTDLNDDLTQPNSDGCECVGDASVPDICDGLDNDCNGLVDQPSSALLIACQPPANAEAVGCDAGSCTIACADGFADTNGDLAQADSDGCECALSNNGVEICDGLDNDCDGTIDEPNSALVSNCATLDGASATCDEGACVWACDNNRVDTNDDLSSANSDGCECAITSFGLEACDGLDNDCDGLIDDQDPDFISVICTPSRGVCAGLEAVCIDGTVSSCDLDYFTANLPDPTLFEGFSDTLELVCDGFDGNCNGRVDENCCDANAREGVFSLVQPAQSANRQVLPSLAVSPDAQYIAVAWQDTSGSETNGVPDSGVVHLSFGNIDGSTNTTSNISIDETETANPIMINHSDGIFAFWLEKSFGSSAIVQRGYGWNGSANSARFATIQQIESIQGFDAKSIEDNLVIAWASGRECSNPAALSCIQIKATTTTGTVVHDTVELTDTQLGANDINPRIAWAQSGGLVVWHNRPISPFESKEIHWAVVNNQLEIQERGRLDLILDPDAQPHPLAYNGSFFVAFVDLNQQSVNQIKLLRIGSDGQAIGEPRIVVPSGTTQRAPRLVETPDGVALVWVEGEGGASQTLFVLLDDDGNATRAPTTLWSGSMNYLPIAAAPVPSIGAVVAASLENDSGDERVQYSIINADGDRLCLP